MLVPLLDADPARIGGKGSALRRLALHGLPVPRTWVLPAGAALGGVPADLPRLLAVRSSAIEEDGRHASHAGQYLSVLGVAPADLADAVHRVHASYDAPHAVAYRGTLLKK